MNACEKRLTVCVAYGVLDRTLSRCRLEGTTFKPYPNSLFEDGTGPGLEPVDGEFQPSFASVHPGGGAHLFFSITFYFRTKGSSKVITVTYTFQGSDFIRNLPRDQGPFRPCDG